ncbi:GDP-mannose transporter GONST3, partial [Mucuna pruriens]
MARQRKRTRTKAENESSEEKIQRKQNRRRGSVVYDNDEPLLHSILMSKDTDVENPSNNIAVQKGVDVNENVNVSDGEGNWYSYVVHQISVYGVAAGYCLSASLLSIINKWAVMKFPYPGALTALQYFTSAAGVLLCSRLKLLEHDPLDLMTMWRFLPAAIIFYLSLFTNSELLLHANVDTFIVFRSVVPLFVAVGETLFLHQPWPSATTWTSLATIFAGSVLYVVTDYQFTFMAYSWALAYLVSMTIDFVYIKHVVMTIGLNTWGLVLYNNLEALLLFPLELLIMGELKKIKHEINDESDWHSFQVVLPVGLSCLFGLSISFFGFSCRRAISATGFTVLGIVNKLLTVVINLVIWDKHSTWVGTVGLLICMLGGIMYQQSTSKPKAAKQMSAQENEEEQEKLLEMQVNSETNNINNNEGSEDWLDQHEHIVIAEDGFMNLKIEKIQNCVNSRILADFPLRASPAISSPTQEDPGRVHLGQAEPHNQMAHLPTQKSPQLQLRCHITLGVTNNAHYKVHYLALAFSICGGARCCIGVSLDRGSTGLRLRSRSLSEQLNPPVYCFPSPRQRQSISVASVLHLVKTKLDKSLTRPYRLSFCREQIDKCKDESILYILGSTSFRFTSNHNWAHCVLEKNRPKVDYAIVSFSYLMHIETTKNELITRPPSFHLVLKGK